MTKPTISPDSVVRASPRQVSTQLGLETVILGVEKGQYFSLNEVGAKIWEFAQDWSSVRSLCDRLLLEYDVSPAVLETDVLEILGDLSAQGLIQVQVTK
jgi:hypothetical protein